MNIKKTYHAHNAPEDAGEVDMKPLLNPGSHLRIVSTNGDWQIQPTTNLAQLPGRKPVLVYCFVFQSPRGAQG
jgi:hypothetical protein